MENDITKNMDFEMILKDFSDKKQKTKNKTQEFVFRKLMHNQ